jgi:hypothetical protein
MTKRQTLTGDKRGAKHNVYPKVNRKRDLPRSKPSRLALLANGSSLGEIARACRISVAHLSRVSTGKRQFSLQTAARVAVYLGVTIDQLYTVLSGADVPDRQ